ncbi:Na/Pi symporter [Corynebacterium sp.]|uniref:Na/Pi symporter n=1 Tax=Corynebacterium sp. TaxID=1720 RepID=UPI0037350572
MTTSFRGPGTISTVFPLEEGTDRVALSTAGKAVRIAVVVVAVFLLVLSVYLVALGVNELSATRAQRMFEFAGHPIVALAVGVLATALVQSSSTVTTFTVAAVATGALDLSSAIPLILGANIGTTITPLLISFSYVRDKVAFRRAHSTAALHFWFNAIGVALVFPLEYFFGPARRLLPEISLPDEQLWFGPVFEIATILPIYGGWAILAGVVLLIVSIRLIDRQLKHLLTPLAWRVLGHTSHRSALAGFGGGLMLTLLIQASSATVSATLPFATAKLADARGYLAIITGANVGTTFIAVLAAFATPGDFSDIALQAALVHVLFNVAGAIAVAIISPLRRLIYRLAEYQGQQAERSAWSAAAFIATIWFALPALCMLAYTITH